MIRAGSIDEVQAIIKEIPEFVKPYGKAAFEERLNTKNSLILVAEIDGRLVGFKCGYERENGKETFYSWMGGVVPASRRSGIALALLLAMEQWCKRSGYRYLTFKTQNRHKAMIIFALKNGFSIQAVETSETDKELRIWLIKELNK